VSAPFAGAWIAGLESSQRKGGSKYYPFSNLGAYATAGAQVTHAGYPLLAYVHFLQLHGIETPPSACANASLASAPDACRLLLTGVAP
jgi:hypothetical protein